MLVNVGNHWNLFLLMTESVTVDALKTMTMIGKINFIFCP